jgi:hypothetical protein
VTWPLAGDLVAATDQRTALVRPGERLDQAIAHCAPHELRLVDPDLLAVLSIHVRRSLVALTPPTDPDERKLLPVVAWVGAGRVRHEQAPAPNPAWPTRWAAPDRRPERVRITLPSAEVVLNLEDPLEGALWRVLVLSSDPERPTPVTLLVDQLRNRVHGEDARSLAPRGDARSGRSAWQPCV